MCSISLKKKYIIFSGEIILGKLILSRRKSIYESVAIKSLTNIVL